MFVTWTISTKKALICFPTSLPYTRSATTRHIVTNMCLPQILPNRLTDKYPPGLDMCQTSCPIAFYFIAYVPLLCSFIISAGQHDLILQWNPGSKTTQTTTEVFYLVWWRQEETTFIIVSYVCSDSLMLRDTLEFLFKLSNWCFTIRKVNFALRESVLVSSICTVFLLRLLVTVKLWVYV